MSLPPDKIINDHDKQGYYAFSLKPMEQDTNVIVSKTDQELSTNYLYQVMEKQISADSEMAAKFRLRPVGDNLIMTISIADYLNLAPKLAKLLKPIKNEIWLYSSNLAVSKKAYDKLVQNGYDKKITFLEADITKTQIDIVIFP